MQQDFILQGKTFHFTQQSAGFAQKYLDRVRKYVESHNLGHEYYEDIEARFAEKIEEKNDPSNDIFSESDLIRIVNELGEPEDIFRDIGSSDKTSGASPKNSLFPPRGELHRNSKRGMIFGVCAGLGETFGIDATYFRLLFVLSLLFYGAGILVYLVLAILLKNAPLTSEELEKEYPEAAHLTTLPLVKTLHRNSAQGMIFGVCAGLGESFGIDPVYFRLLFILLVLFFGTGILVYVLLAFLLKDIPVKGPEETDRSSLSLSEGVVKNTLQGIPETMKNTLHGIPKVGNGLFSFVASVFFFILFGILGFTLMGLAIAAIFASSFLVSGVNIANQILFPAMPVWFYAACIVFSLVISIFSVAAFARAFGKNLFSGPIFVILIGTIVLSLVWLLSGGLGLVSQYSFVKTSEVVYPLVANSGSVDLDIKIAPEKYIGFHFGEDISFTDLKIESTSAETGSIVIRETFYTKDEQAQELLRNSIVPLQVAGSSGKISISLSGSKIFTRSVPFAFPERTIIVRIPKNLSMKVHGYTGHISGITQNELDRYIPGECGETGIRYSESKGILECDPLGYTQKALQEGYAGYIEDHFGWILAKDSLDFGSVVEWKDDHTARVKYRNYENGSDSEETAWIYVTYDANGYIQAKITQ